MRQMNLADPRHTVTAAPTLSLRLGKFRGRGGEDVQLLTGICGFAPLERLDVQGTAPPSGKTYISPVKHRVLS